MTTSYKTRTIYIGGTQITAHLVHKQADVYYPKIKQLQVTFFILFVGEKVFKSLGQGGGGNPKVKVLNTYYIITYHT